MTISIHKSHPICFEPSGPGAEISSIISNNHKTGPARRTGDLDRRFRRWKNASRKRAVPGSLQAEEKGAFRGGGRLDQRCSCGDVAGRI